MSKQNGTILIQNKALSVSVDSYKKKSTILEKFDLTSRLNNMLIDA